jgi:hypothetical protein
MPPSRSRPSPHGQDFSRRLSAPALPTPRDPRRLRVAEERPERQLDEFTTQIAASVHLAPKDRLHREENAGCQEPTDPLRRSIGPENGPAFLEHVSKRVDEIVAAVPALWPQQSLGMHEAELHHERFFADGAEHCSDRRRDSLCPRLLQPACRFHSPDQLSRRLFAGDRRERRRRAERPGEHRRRHARERGDVLQVRHVGRVMGKARDRDDSGASTTLYADFIRQDDVGSLGEPLRILGPIVTRHPVRAPLASMPRRHSRENLTLSSEIFFPLGDSVSLRGGSMGTAR